MKNLKRTVLENMKKVSKISAEMPKTAESWSCEPRRLENFFGAFHKMEGRRKKPPDRKKGTSKVRVGNERKVRTPTRKKAQVNLTLWIDEKYLRMFV